MFDRCDTEAREIVHAALAESRRMGHNWLGTEHVLLAMAQRRQALPADVARLLPDARAIESRLGGLYAAAPRPDGELLKVVGVDLEQVRSAVRRTFGDAAIDDLGRRRVHQPWQPWRRPTRRCMSILAGSLSIAPRLKLAFERARQDADRRKVPNIDAAALLLGMLEVENAMSSRILADLHVDLELLRGSLGGSAG